MRNILTYLNFELKHPDNYF